MKPTEYRKQKNIFFKQKKKRAGFKRLIFAFLLLVILFCLIFKIFNSDKNFLCVSFLDVGQGDASLIRIGGGKIILVDGGPDNLVLRRLGEQLPFYARNIEAIVVSHFHEDHVTGLIEIAHRYKIKKIIYADGANVSDLGKIFFAVAKKSGAQIIPLEKEGKLLLKNNCFIFFINPISFGTKINDNNSLVAKLSCGQKEFLFAGDNEADAERSLLKSGINISADIFKASHHGSKTSNSFYFLKAINPKKIIVFVGKNNKFGHPSTEVIENAARLGIEVLRTDKAGTINIFSNIE